MTRVLVNTANTIYVSFAVGETPTDADAAVTVTVKDPYGVTVSTGAATNEPTAIGLYSYLIPGVADPTRLSVTWAGLFGGNASSVTESHEVVGKFLFALSDLRAMDGLDSVVDYPTAALVETRDLVTDLFVSYCHTAWGEAYMRETFDGDGEDYVLLTYLPTVRVLRVDKSGVQATITDWTVDDSGRLETGSGVFFTKGRRNFVVDYVFGHPTVPGDLKRAALKLARAWLLSGDSSIPDRARMMTTEWGTFQLTNAALEYPTGMPEVDSVLNRYSYRLPGFA